MWCGWSTASSSFGFFEGVGQLFTRHERILQGAVKSVFDRYYNVNDLESIAMSFNDGLSVDVGEGVAAEDYATIGELVPGLMDVFPDRERVSNGVRATTIEFILEGLHLHKLLNKFDHRGAATYSG